MNATIRTCQALALMAFVSPDTLFAGAHSGVIVRDGFALSDVALAVAAAAGVILARRSMRKRARRKD